MSLRLLRDALASFGVSQRHGLDSSAWRLILEALADRESPAPVREAVFDGRGDAVKLLEAVAAKTSAGQPWFPFLSGPKISVMWVRMLAAPGGATIRRLDHLPVAVDVQVRKVSEYLGVASTGDRPIEDVREVIQAVWRDLAGDVVVARPMNLAGTCAGLDPALWFFGSWGCTYCEKVAAPKESSDNNRSIVGIWHRLTIWRICLLTVPKPIGRACAGCRFPNPQ